MRILILGATGKVATLTTGRALSAGHDVTGLARDPAKLRGQVWSGSPRFRAVRGDVTDADAVRRIVAGHDCVLCTFGAPLTRETILGVPDLCTVATRHVVSAMSEAGVRRLIVMSSIGVGSSRRQGRWVFRNVIRPLLLGRILIDRERQEHLVHDSGLDWTLVRPAEMTDGPATHSYRVLEPGAAGPAAAVATISRADVADFLVRDIESARHIQRTVVLCR